MQLSSGDPGLATTRRTLATAFQDDPMMVHLLPDAAARTRRLPGFLGRTQDHCLRYGEVHATSDGAAVSCWLRPGHTNPGPGEALRGGLVDAGLRLGPAGLRRLLRLTGVMDRAHHQVQPAPHWYLFLLAVEPSRQGQGLPTEVLQPVLRRADAEGLPVYLDTHNPANVGYYARHGFQQVVAEAVDGVRFWGLRRMPDSEPG